MPEQLVLPFHARQGFGREAFIAAPCNEQALRFVERWPDWPAQAAVLYGPKGSGKSHLVSVWRELSGAAYVTAEQLSPDALPADGPLVVEDVDAVPPSLGRDRTLLALFERPSAALLLTGRKPPSEWETAIGDLRSRFDSVLAFPLWAPDDSLMAALVRKHFADRQLEVPDAVVRRILTHVERSPEAVASFVARADAKALAEKRAVSERLVLELLDAEERG